jgi:hypothetical protein
MKAPNVLREMGRLGRDAARVAMTGIPAVRAALHGARLGAVGGLTAEVVERLGISVLPLPAQHVARGLLRGGRALGVALARRGAVVRAEARRVVVQGRDGVAVTVAPGGTVAASATEDTVRAIARGSGRAALRGIGRAAAQGAFAGAVLDGGIAAWSALGAVRAGSITPRRAGVRVLLGASRGALAGAAGVTAAGVVSAGVALTGLTIAGAPVVLPIVTMAGVSGVVARSFDRVVAPKVEGAILPERGQANP